MLVDMHLHESTCSSDSKMTLEEIVATARERGLDAVCITDHDSMGLKETAERYSRETGFPIFVGVEYFSLWGDITAFGIDRFPDKRIPAQDFVDQVNAAGGFCVACHPFRNNNRGFEDHLWEIQGLHGVEVLNGSTGRHFPSVRQGICRWWEPATPTGPASWENTLPWSQGNRKTWRNSWRLFIRAV